MSTSVAFYLFKRFRQVPSHDLYALLFILSNVTDHLSQTELPELRERVTGFIVTITIVDNDEVN